MKPSAEPRQPHYRAEKRCRLWSVRIEPLTVAQLANTFSITKAEDDKNSVKPSKGRYRTRTR